MRCSTTRERTRTELCNLTHFEAAKMLALFCCLNCSPLGFVSPQRLFLWGNTIIYPPRIPQNCRGFKVAALPATRRFCLDAPGVRPVIWPFWSFYGTNHLCSFVLSPSFRLHFTHPLTELIKCHCVNRHALQFSKEVKSRFTYQFSIDLWNLFLFFLILFYF